MREVDSDRAGTKPAQLETRAANGTPDIERSGGSRHSPTVDELMNASHREVQSFAWSRMFSQNLLFRTVVKEEIFGEQPGRFIRIKHVSARKLSRKLRPRHSVLLAEERIKILGRLVVFDQHGYLAVA